MEGVRDCGEVPQRCAPPFLQHKPERNTSMKLTKNDIKQKRAELVEVLPKIEKLKAKAA